MPVPPGKSRQDRAKECGGALRHFAGRSNMDKINLFARVELDSLTAVTTFVSAAEHLKSLTLQLAELRQRRSRREHSLALQIECITTLCGEKAAEVPYLADLWRVAQAELEALAQAPPPCPHQAPAEPCKGGAA